MIKIFIYQILETGVLVQTFTEINTIVTDYNNNILVVTDSTCYSNVESFTPIKDRIVGDLEFNGIISIYDLKHRITL